MKRREMAVGLLSWLTASLYIPIVQETAGLEIMAFLGSEAGSERGAVTAWYAVCFVLSAALLIAGWARRNRRYYAAVFVLVSLTALVHMLPFCLWLIVLLIDAAYKPGMLMVLLHGGLLMLSIQLALQYMKHSYRASEA